MKELFDDILERDEVIIDVIKPEKCRYWKTPLIFLALPIFWPHFIMLMVITFFTLPIFYAKGYKNIYYAYTNKRLIVRSGIFGVNFQSLEYKDITSTSVNVSFLDKGSGTGSISFTSPSSHHNSIVFSYIKNPYDVMRNIKEYIEIANKK